MLVREIYEKGQVVIPKNLREMLGMRAGTKVVFEVEGDRMIIKKARNIKKEFEKIAAQGESISKIDLDKEYEEQIEERMRRIGVDVP